MTRIPDSPLLADALTADRRLRAFARALCADEHRAEDLAQHAWLRALERGVRDGLGGFLRRVVQNRAVDEARVARRRAARELGAARSDAVPSAAEIAAREQTRRRLADAVGRLEEPYRTTIWLRFFEGLPPRDVARRMGVPVETVRTRQRRALERLRAELDEEHGGRAAWVGMLLPLGGRSAAAVTPFAVVTGWLLMHKTSVTLAAGALAALALVPFLAPSESATPLATAPPGTDAATRAVSVPPGEQPAADAERSMVDTAAPGALAEAVRMRLRHDDGRPAAGLTYWLWREPRPRQAWVPSAYGALGTTAPVLGEPDGTTGEAGGFTLSDPDAPGVTFRVDERLLVSFALATAPSADGLVLPALQRITVGLIGAGPDDRWRARAYPGVGDPLDPDTWNWAMSHAYEVPSASGPAVVFVERSVTVAAGDARLQLLAPVGRTFGVEVEGVGFQIDPAYVLAAAPSDLSFRVVRRRPGIEVVLVEADGAPTTLEGHVACTGEREGEYEDTPLEGGHALLAQDFRPGARYLVRAVVEDGEEFLEEVTLDSEDGVRRVRFVRGEGRPRTRVPLPTELAPEHLAAAMVLAADGTAQDAVPWSEQWFERGAAPCTFACVDGVVALSGVPEGWMRIVLIADDGRAWEARPRAGGPDPVPADRLRPLRLEEERRAHPGTGYGFFVFELSYLDERGGTTTLELRWLRVDPATGELPVWELLVPRGFTARVRHRAGREWREVPIGRVR